MNMEKPTQILAMFFRPKLNIYIFLLWFNLEKYIRWSSYIKGRIRSQILSFYGFADQNSYPYPNDMDQIKVNLEIKTDFDFVSRLTLNSWNGWTRKPRSCTRKTNMSRAKLISKHPSRSNFPSHPNYIVPPGQHHSGLKIYYVTRWRR